MRLFVVEETYGGAEGEYVPLDVLASRLQRSRETVLVPLAREQLNALDAALLATLNIAHVGMVIPFRLGWVFIAEDAQT